MQAIRTGIPAPQRPDWLPQMLPAKGPAWGRDRPCLSSLDHAPSRHKPPVAGTVKKVTYPTTFCGARVPRRRPFAVASSAGTEIATATHTSAARSPACTLFRADSRPRTVAFPRGGRLRGPFVSLAARLRFDVFSGEPVVGGLGWEPDAKVRPWDNAKAVEPETRQSIELQ